jgi:hypothetical protein
MSSILLSVLTVCYMFILRGRKALEKKRVEEVTKKWEETIYNAILGHEPEKPPKKRNASKLTAGDGKNSLLPNLEKGKPGQVEPLPKEELTHFLYLWNYLHESLRGSSKEQLNSLAQTLKIDGSAYKMLKSRSLKNRILAINTFGNLRDRKTYGEIEKLIDDRDPVISLWAWRALLRIDFEEAIAGHFSMIATRADWSPIFVAKVLLEQETDLLSEPLVALVEKYWENNLAERQMARLISYLNITHISSYSPLVDKILAESDQTEVLIACLRLVKTDESLERVRALFKSGRWEIRLQVVQTLGRLGHAEDIDLLIDALNDLDWWVRYRSARALMKMPAMTTRKLTRLAKTLPNEFARDMLRQVLAEERLLCFNQTPPSILSR